jgi:hypothetical protein
VTEILKQVAALEARILTMEETNLAAMITGRRD